MKQLSIMPKKTHSVKLCLLRKCGTARAPLIAPVCNESGLALASPAAKRRLQRTKQRRRITTLFIIHCSLFIYFSCASGGNRNDSADAPVSLEQAIERAAGHIAGDLKPGARIAIVDFESENDNLSHHIMEELTGELLKHKIEVADRQNLPYIFKEFELQMSGAVSDETAQSVGKILGAELIIVGRLLDIVEMYRNQVDAVHVGQATRESAARNNVRKDRATKRLITALAKQQTTVKVFRYGVTEQTKPETAGIFLDRGIMFAMRGEYDKAIADFTEAIRLNPDMVGAYMLRARALRANISNVLGVYENFSGIETRSTEGRASLDKMRVFDQIILDLTQAIRLDPNNDIPYSERGIAYSDMGDIDWAIEDFNQAIRIDPDDYASYSNRGNAYKIKHDYDRAIEDYNRAIRLNSNAAYSYINRGTSYAYKNEWDYAIADYSRAIRLLPNSPEGYKNRGAAFLNKGDWDRAINDFNQAIKLLPNSPEGYNTRAAAYALKGDYERAIADWETVLRINPNDSNAKSRIEMFRNIR